MQLPDNPDNKYRQNRKTQHFAMTPATVQKIFYHLFTTILFLYDSLF
jgi:hypothetical protein